MPQTILPVDRKLARAEAAQLRQLEDVLATARRWAMEEAKALYKIQQGRLYRAEFDSFEEYAIDKWGYERSYAHRLAQWGETLTNLLPIGTDDLPERESHARPLYALRPSVQRKVWTAVCKRYKASRTAADVEHVVQQIVHHRSPQATSGTNPATGTVICADAIDGLNTLTNGSVDLVLFSPPYCEQRKSHYPSIPESEFPKWILRLMAAARPKLSQCGNVLIVAREHLRHGQISDVWLRTRLSLREAGWIECESLVWYAPDKPPLGRNDRPRRAYENIYWFSTTSSPFTDVKACGAPFVEPPTRVKRYRTHVAHGPQTFTRFRDGDNARTTDVIVAPVGGGGISKAADHPAMMPAKLAEQLVKTFSPPGGFVADPCCGGATTLLAARDCGRRWWGCDIVPKYAKLSRERLMSPLNDTR